MDKKGTKILLGCILCTVIVLMLFIIVIKFTQLSCELVALEPVALRNSQLDQFKRDKPIRSHDKTILLKISAFLEYNVQETSSGSSSSDKSNNAGGSTTPTNGANNAQSDPPRLTINNANLNVVAAPGQTGGGGANNSNNQHQGNFGNKSLTGGGGPQPSVPQNNFNPLQNSSFVVATKPLPGQHQAVNYGQHQHPRAEKRFLPLELDRIETRNLGNDKHRYILSFNCTKLNMVLVHVNNTVYVEHMDMELKPVGIRQKASCELTLAGGKAFFVPPPAVGAPATAAASHQQHQPSSSTQAPHLNVMTNVTNGAHPTPPATGALPAAQSDHSASKKDDARNLARYFCDKPLRFECHYWNKKPGPTATNGFLLADLQINAIEFETSRGPSSKGEHKHVKSEFKSKQSVCM